MTDFKKTASECRDNAIYYFNRGDIKNGRKYEKLAKYFEGLAELDEDEAPQEPRK